MKKTNAVNLLALALTLLMVVPGQTVVAATIGQPQSPGGDSWPTLEQLEGRAWIVVDCDTGDVLLSKNADVQNYPASITKIMTAIIAIEAGSLDDTVMVSATAVKLPYGSSKAGFLAGETLVVRDVLAGLMLASGNDAANVLAEKIGGSTAGFAALMNAKAVALGMMNSHFTNASGLHDPNHTVSARDMATLAVYAMKNDIFRELVATRVYSMPVTNLHTFSGWGIYANTNRFLNYGETFFQSDQIAEYQGIKTGSTDAAGNNLVSAALTTTGHKLVAVILGVPLDSQAGNPYIYSRTLLEAAAAKTTPVETIPPTTQSSVTETTTPPTTTSTSGQPITQLSFDDPWCVAFLFLLTITLLLAVLLILVISRKKRGVS